MQFLSQRECTGPARQHSSWTGCRGGGSTSIRQVPFNHVFKRTLSRALILPQHVPPSGRNMDTQDVESLPSDTVVNDMCWFMQVPTALQPYPSSRLAILARVPPTFEALIETIYDPGMGLDMPAPASITVLPYQADGAASSTSRFFIPLWEHYALQQPLHQGPHDVHSPCLLDFTGTAPILWRPGGLPSSSLYRLRREVTDDDQAAPISSAPFAAPLRSRPA